MLWNVVYEFFIKYIFGGRISSGIFDGSLGIAYNIDNQGYSGITTATVFANISFGQNSNWRLPLGNYLSLIATIISMVVILVLCCALIKKIYNMCAHIIG